MDRRLIQTAVFGSPDSDAPALCPETPEELEAFRREHDGITIWCGTQFEGGCGRRLTTRLCADKICHFAHYGSGGGGQSCGRKDRGKDDANHLFAKAHLASWLRTQGVTAEFAFPEPLGSAVTVRLQDGRSLLLHLDRSRPVPWDPGTWEVILGPGVRDPHALTQRGYLHRVRFVDRPGGGRVMLFGTELYGRGTEVWDALDGIVLGPEGLVSRTRSAATRTPAPAPQRAEPTGGREIVTITRHTAPSPRRADPVQKLLRHLDTDNGSPKTIRAAVETIHQLLETDLHPDDASRLRFVLPKCQRRLEQHAQHRQSVVRQLREAPTEKLHALAVALLRDDPDASQEERDIVDALTLQMDRKRAEKRAAQRAAAKLAREEKRRAEEKRREERLQEEARKLEAMRQAMEQERAERAAAAERANRARERALEQARQARAEKAGKLAPAVRGALKKAAREQRVTTWGELRDKTGLRQLERLSHEDKLAILALVEADTAAEEPLWSALLVEDDIRLQRDICRLLGRPLPVSDADLIDQLTMERHRLHRQW
ncbi:MULTISPECIES: hypothetical protein [Streptomyces]|uniref:hypothetical protein n=1 Tax=Streptomyces TaxID=1883 RepID=UPI00067CC4C9|nr:MULTISPECIES: hypothetical protein [Streptomyces]